MDVFSFQGKKARNLRLEGDELFRFEGAESIPDAILFQAQVSEGLPLQVQRNSIEFSRKILWDEMT
jgi:hypothetical protein